MKSIRTILFENKSDEKFRAFTASLLPTVKNESVIGVPQPVLRRIAKELLKECELSDVGETFGEGDGSRADRDSSGCRNSAERKSFCESGASYGRRNSAERKSLREGGGSCASGSSDECESFREGGASRVDGSSSGRESFRDGGGACAGECSGGSELLRSGSGSLGRGSSGESESFCEGSASCVGGSSGMRESLREGCGSCGGESSGGRESFCEGSASCAGGNSGGCESFRDGGGSCVDGSSAEYEASRARAAEISAFMRELPHEFYEEQTLHGLFIEAGRDFGRVCAELNEFLPFVDNWATCDAIRPKVFAQNLGALLPRIEKWLQSGRTYEIRFGVKMLMDFYLDGAFKIEYAQRVAEIVSDEYYVNMMLAWYFATALAKQYDAVLPFLEQRRLGAWVHNKTIQKAVESRRISDERKAVLRFLRQPRQPCV